MKTFPLYLNGEFVVTADSSAVTNPATNQPIAQMSRIDPTRLSAAIKDAHAALPEWRALTAKSRGEYLLKIADEMERRRDEIARTITTENGKPLSQSAGEVTMTLSGFHPLSFSRKSTSAY